MAAEGEWEEVAGEPDAEAVYEDETAEPEPEAAYEEPPRYGREPPRAVTRPDKSVLAMLSGLGFFVVALLLVLGVWGIAATVPDGGLAFGAVIVVGLVLTVVIPYLWMLDDLRIRPRSLRKSHARFIAGPLIGVLAIVLFGLFTLATGNLLLIILSVAVLGLMQASVGLFLYSMLWEE
jgi:hypothetical protein